MPPPTPTIRRATPADLSAILALLDLYYTEWDIWQRDPPEKIFQDLHHPHLGFFLTELNNTPAACVLLRELPAIPLAAECKRLFVAPGFRGHGLAHALMDAAEAAALSTHLDYLYLDTKSEFTTAIDLYRRRGYEEIPRYNDNPQATIFLRKRLIE
jgi:ribosomal protein S18 acetylase RimI-like enzyme